MEYTQEVKTKAKECLSLSRCLLRALGDSTLVSDCIEQHMNLIPVQDIKKLEDLMNSNDQPVRMGLDMVLNRSIADCRRIVFDMPSQGKGVKYENVTKLLKALVSEKRPEINKHPSINPSIEVHFKDRVLPITDIDRVGEKSLKLLRSWFRLAENSDSEFVDIYISNPKSITFILYTHLRKAKVIGDSSDTSPVVKYKRASYKMFKTEMDNKIFLRVQLLH